jgi:hypothetical protein
MKNLSHWNGIKAAGCRCYIALLLTATGALGQTTTRKFEELASTTSVSAADRVILNRPLGGSTYDNRLVTFANFKIALELPVIGEDVQAWDADLDAWALKTAPSGTVAGTSDTQTLTNKTLTAPVLNLGSDATADVYYRGSDGLLKRLPAGSNGQVLKLSSGLPSWGTDIAEAGAGGGTVTSVGLTVPTGFSVTGSPVTTSGSLAITTTLSGVLKGNGSGFVAATAGTDYLTPSGDGGSLTNLNGTAIASGTVADARIASTIARDSEVTALTDALDTRITAVEDDLADDIDFGAAPDLSIMAIDETNTPSYITTAAGINAVTSDDDFLTLTGTQTATNKTFTSPTITGGAVDTASGGDNDTSPASTAFVQSTARGSKTGVHATPDTTNPLAPTWTSIMHVVWYGATGEIDLPAASGYTDRSILIYNTGAFTVTIDPNGSEVIVRDGTVQTGGVTMTLSSGAGNFVALISDGARWITLGYKGTLAAGS